MRKEFPVKRSGFGWSNVISEEIIQDHPDWNYSSAEQIWQIIELNTFNHYYERRVN